MTQAVILAAGQGQRLKPLTNDRPKGMVDVAGSTIIERQIGLFRRAGIGDIAVVKGFCAESVPDYGIRHYVNSEYSRTNMVYSLFAADAGFGGEDLIVSYGDILYSDAVLNALLASTAPVSVVVDLEWERYFRQRMDDPYDDAESLVLDESRRIRSIGQRNPDPKDIQAQYIGLMKFDRAGLAEIRRVRDDASPGNVSIGWGRPWQQAYMTDLLQELVLRDVGVQGVPIRGGWCEIDSLRDYEIASRIVPALYPQNV